MQDVPEIEIWGNGDEFSCKYKFIKENNFFSYRFYSRVNHFTISEKKYEKQCKNCNIQTNTQSPPYDLIFSHITRYSCGILIITLIRFKSIPVGERRTARLRMQRLSFCFSASSSVAPRISRWHSANSCGIFAVRPSFESSQRSANSPKWNQPLRKVLEMRSLTDKMARPSLSPCF